jgi:hypothetical protein
MGRQICKTSFKIAVNVKNSHILSDWNMASNIKYNIMKDLVNFGQYLLSEEREKRLKTGITKNSLPYNEKKRFVFDSDLENYKK